MWKVYPQFQKVKWCEKYIPIPVSYTHLDVYKRQLKDQSIHILPDLMTI